MFEVEYACGRMYLIYTGGVIAELINGEKGLDKQYGGSILKWIETIKKRDMKHISSINNQIDSLETKKAFLIDLWGDTNE